MSAPEQQPQSKTHHSKFQRVLWAKQDFEDNHTPPSFPYCVVFNENARYRSFGYLLIHSLWILDHISLVIVFFDIFLLCDNGSIHSFSLFLINIFFIFFALCLSQSASSIKNKFVRIYVIGILLIILCPLLRTLTETISTDTVWTMTIICAVVHLLSADYEFDKYKKQKSANYVFSASVSLNAAVFMSVLLASRLKSNDFALSFLLFSFILFGGGTYFIRDIKLKNDGCNVMISLFLCFLNYSLICFQRQIIKDTVFDYQNDVRLMSLLYAYQYSVFVVVVLGPIGFYRIQQYKVTIGGPWTYDTEGEASQYMVDSSNIRTKK